MLNEALDLQFTSGCTLGEACLELGLLTDVQLAELTAEHARIPFVAVDALAFRPEQLNEIPEAVARKHTLMPLAREGKRLDVVMARPQDLDAIQELTFLTGVQDQPALRGPVPDPRRHRPLLPPPHLEGAPLPSWPPAPPRWRTPS